MGSCFSSSSSRTRMVDYYYSPALYDYDKVFGTSQENYVRDDLQLYSSTAEINHHPQLQRNIATCITQEEPEIKIKNEPAEPSRRLCMICFDEKSSSDIFRGTTNCTHSYCTECTVRYVATKIEENIAMIKCPDVDCTQMIEPYTCRDLIPHDMFERWDKALCESLILSSEKVYCPFEDCSAMMVVDDNDAKVTETECPSCHRLFCAQCKVTWHAGIQCQEVQRFGNTKKKSSDEEDAMFVQMANNKQWRRCPRCKFYVEKVNGCMHISCRCGIKFCYQCGLALDRFRGHIICNCNEQLRQTILNLQRNSLHNNIWINDIPTMDRQFPQYTRSPQMALAASLFLGRRRF